MFIEYKSSAENQKGVNAVKLCSAENQMGAIAIDCTVLVEKW